MGGKGHPASSLCRSWHGRNRIRWTQGLCRSMASPQTIGPWDTKSGRHKGNTTTTPLWHPHITLRSLATASVNGGITICKSHGYHQERRSGEPWLPFHKRCVAGDAERTSTRLIAATIRSANTLHFFMVATANSAQENVLKGGRNTAKHSL